MVGDSDASDPTKLEDRHLNLALSEFLDRCQVIEKNALLSKVVSTLGFVAVATRTIIYGLRRGVYQYFRFTAK